MFWSRAEVRDIVLVRSEGRDPGHGQSQGQDSGNDQVFFLVFFFRGRVDLGQSHGTPSGIQVMIKTRSR